MRFQTNHNQVRLKADLYLSPRSSRNRRHKSEVI